GVCGADVHGKAGKAGSHADGLSHVQCLLDIVAAAAAAVGAGGAGSVGGEQGDGHVVGLVGVREIGVQVGEIGSVELKQPEVLAGSGERSVAVVGSAHIAAEERGRGAGAGGGVGHNLADRESVGRSVVALLSVQSARDGEVVQAGDVPELEVEAGGGFAVGRIEVSVLRGVLVEAH